MWLSKLEIESALDWYVELIEKVISTTVGVSTSELMLMLGLQYFVGSDFSRTSNSYSSVGMKPYFDQIILSAV